MTVPLEVKTMYRPLTVCAQCWNEVYPNRTAVRSLLGEEAMCIVCEEQTRDSIFVRMKVEWQLKL